MQISRLAKSRKVIEIIGYESIDRDPSGTASAHEIANHPEFESAVFDCVRSLCCCHLKHVFIESRADLTLLTKPGAFRSF
jgi:hypothetical protein